MEFVKIHISKKQLMSISEHERLFLINAMMLLNEMTTLLRCGLLTDSIAKEENETLQQAKVTQELFFYRTLAGKLYEGWVLMKKGYFSNKLISAKYEAKLPRKAKIALNVLKRYFGKNNQIENIRNNYSFHYPVIIAEINKLLEKIPKKETFDILIHKDIGNCKYFISDEIFIYAISNKAKIKKFKINDKRIGKALFIFMKNLDKITRKFIVFLGELTLKILEEPLDLKSKPDFKMINLPDPKENVTIPCFYNFNLKSFENTNVNSIGQHKIEAN